MRKFFVKLVLDEIFPVVYDFWFYRKWTPTLYLQYITLYYYYTIYIFFYCLKGFNFQLFHFFTKKISWKHRQLGQKLPKFFWIKLQASLIFSKIIIRCAEKLSCLRVSSGYIEREVHSHSSNKLEANSKYCLLTRFCFLSIFSKKLTNNSEIPNYHTEIIVILKFYKNI